VWNDLTEKWAIDMEDPYVTYKPNTWKPFGDLKQIYNKDLMYKATPFSRILQKQEQDCRRMK
jgi:hypothetical protein